MEINRGITPIDQLKPADRGSSSTFSERSCKRNSTTDTDTVDFTDSVTTVRRVNNIIAVIATNIVNNAITVVTITIVTITSLANNVVIIANVFASFFFSVPTKNIIIAITAVSVIMVRSIKSTFVVTSSLRLLYCFPFLFSFTDSITTVRWVANIIAVIATNIVYNAITVVTITIVTIRRLANIVGVTDTVDFTNSVTTVRWVNNIIAVNATKIVNNAITVVPITIVTITSLANSIVVIAKVFASFFFSIPTKNIVIAITAFSFIMVRSIKSDGIFSWTAIVDTLPALQLMVNYSTTL